MIGPAAEDWLLNTPRADQEQVAKVALGALAQALLLDRVEYMDVLRDHATAVAWLPKTTGPPTIPLKSAARALVGIEPHRPGSMRGPSV
jgi:hypothetical protein